MHIWAWAAPSLAGLGQHGQCYITVGRHGPMGQAPRGRGLHMGCSLAVAQNAVKSQGTYLRTRQSGLGNLFLLRSLGVSGGLITRIPSPPNPKESFCDWLTS